ncbi:hypothetical protein ES703_46712 [subsurface metagenome]
MYVSGNNLACEADDDTTYTAGDALTLTGTEFDFDGGASPSGDLGGTWANPSVDDDSHAHIYSNIDATTSANWDTRVTDDVGSGYWVFNNAPSFTGETSVTATSTSWGAAPSAGWKTTMGTSSGATWLNYGESGGTFRAGVQVLDSGGTMRIYVGSEYISITGNDVSLDKVTVNTVDPVYTIGGERYATYMAGMVGIREEVTGTVRLNSSYTIDFKNLEIGSDLWLFYQITDFGENWEKLQIILTPGFNGNVWYEKNPFENTLTIHGESSGEVSYRMTANRFDWMNWSNLYLEDNDVTGLIAPLK